MPKSPAQRKQQRADAEILARGKDLAWKTIEPRPTIDELMTLLDNEEDVAVEIMPNGEVRQRNRTPRNELGDFKPLTFREDLEAEY
jgi:hypothetical protein